MPDVDEQSAPAAELETTEQQVESDQPGEGDDGDSQSVEQSDEAKAEVELVEIERKGKRYAIPKELESELLMQEDFTRKTQTLAEERKALEQHRELFQQAVAIQRQHAQVFASVAALQSELQKFQGVDWNALTQADPGQAQQAFIRYQTLRDNYAAAQQNLSRVEQQFTYTQQAQREQNLKRAAEQLQREMPAFSKPETTQKLAEHARRLGATEEELAGLDKAWVVKALWEASQYQSIASKANAKPQAQPAQVAQVIKARSAPKSLESMSTEEWMKARQAQVGKKR